MKKILLDQFEGKSNIIHIICDNESDSYVSQARSFDKETSSKGATKLNTVENKTRTFPIQQ